VCGVFEKKNNFPYFDLILKEGVVGRGGIFD